MGQRPVFFWVAPFPPKAMLLGAWIVLMAGCASSSEAGGTGGNRNLITRQEIEETGYTSLYRVVRQLRPRWLASTTSRREREEVLFYLNQTPMEGPGTQLSAIPVTEVDSMVWMSGPEAAVKMPAIGVMGVRPGAVIVIWTRNRGGT